MTGTTRHDAFVALLRQFARADQRREFGFSAGAVGAVPMNDARALDHAQGRAPLALVALLALETACFILAALVPVRNGALLARTFLRRALNGPQGLLHARSVISVGPQPAASDPYFGAFLASEKDSYNYVKIVGGSALREQGWHFVEAALSFPALLVLAMRGLLHPLFVLVRLLAGAGRVEGGSAKLLYLALGFRETRRGTAFQNQLLADALAAHVKSDSVRSVIFPMEGRNWEKQLAACVNARGARPVGYLHCALTPRHAGLLNEGFFAEAELPAVMRTPGTIATRAIAAVFPRLEVRDSYFIRGDRARDTAAAGDGGLLFALTGNVEESGRILRAIPGLKPGSGRAVVRLNPTTATYGRLLRDARELGLETWTAGAALPRLCFFRSSSVAIDYLRLNVVPVYLDLGDAISNNSFDVGGPPRFERVHLGESFASEVAVLSEKYREAALTDGAELADRYLNQNFRPEALAGLHELS